ncbi:MAG: MBL fold metallo-hydrolase [Rhodobiaceae bacterium]|nr:MBL fold metallo-hydrolase [Rhodobiaceae bacterium]
MKPVAREILPGIWRLSDARVVPSERSHFYLVTGSERDCLIDGGWGLDPVRAHLPRNPDKPIVAVATHSHFDHIGALWEFPERWGHAAERAVFAHPDRDNTQAFPYLAGRPVLVAGAEDGALADLPLRPCPLTRLVGDGDRLDLGNKSLTILHVPGHSPGSIAVHDDDAGLLFSGDIVHDGYIFDRIPGANSAVLRESHARILGLDPRLVLPGHGEPLDAQALKARILAYGSLRTR